MLTASMARVRSLSIWVIVVSVDMIVVSIDVPGFSWWSNLEDFFPTELWSLFQGRVQLPWAHIAQTAVVDIKSVASLAIAPANLMSRE